MDGQQAQSDRYDVMKEYDKKLAAHLGLGGITKKPSASDDNPFMKFVG